MKVTYTALTTQDSFWDDKNPPATPQMMKDFESQYKVHIPALLKKIFLESNGGRTEFDTILSNREYFSLFPEWIPPMSEWVPFAQYIEDYDLDDDDTLEFEDRYPGSFICYRHGFEQFTLFWSSPDENISKLGFLNFSAPETAPDRFAMFELSADPTQHFLKAHHQF